LDVLGVHGKLVTNNTYYSFQQYLLEPPTTPIGPHQPLLGAPVN
jgi:hypothetical protein